MVNFLRKYWVILAIIFLVGCLFQFRLKPGFYVMGNDNFTPEINPQLTVSRVLDNPAWRTYRALGIPSDSEQADLWRSFIFSIVSQFIPGWLISQAYLIVTLFIGIFSMGKVASFFLPARPVAASFLGSIFYACSLITVWIYFFPVHLFVAAYAFTPLVIWRMLALLQDPTRKNKAYLLLASLFTGTTALTATMWITSSLTIILSACSYACTRRIRIRRLFAASLIFLLPHLFWILPFATYVKSNKTALQESYINREITATTIESEKSTNTPWNTIRFASAWLDTKEDDVTYTYSDRSWFRSNVLGISLGYIPLVLACIGIIASLLQPKRYMAVILIASVGCIGWILMNGSNPPLGFVYTALESTIPLFKQVFRWGSSKFWPLLFIPLVLLASTGVVTLLDFMRNLRLRIVFLALLTVLLLASVWPAFKNGLVRNDVYVSIPDNYQIALSNIAHDARLETVPHTNTRYFRKHTWGFWGSVFLNYLVPQPTTEKALIIGSKENEMAYEVIDEAYYSGKTDVYTNALKRFNISAVLSDTSVTHQGLGNSYSFPYDWELLAKQTAENGDLQQKSHVNDVRLFTVPPAREESISPISAGHDPYILNKLLALDNVRPYVNSSDIGAYYPLAITPSHMSLQKNLVSWSTQAAHSSPADFRFTIDPRKMSDSPLTASWNNDRFIIAPYFPTFKINSVPITPVPEAVTAIPPDIQSLSVSDQVFTPNKTSILENSQLTELALWKDTLSQDITYQLTQEQLVKCNETEPVTGSYVINTATNHVTIESSDRSCFQTNLNFTKRGPVSVSIDVRSDIPALMEMCVHSLKYNSCLNDPESYFTENNAKQFTVSLNRLFTPGDDLVLFVVLRPLNEVRTRFTVHKVVSEQATKSQSVAAAMPVFSELDRTVRITPNDEISVSIPLPDVIPDFKLFQAKCPERGAHNNMRNLGLAGIQFTTTNCFDGMYANFSLPANFPSSSLMVLGTADNNQGIPLEFNLKENGNPRKISTDLFYPKMNAHLTKFILLPQDAQTYTIEILNKGIGSSPSINSLQAFSAFPIPDTWLGLVLQPVQSTGLDTFSLQPTFDRDTGTFSGTYRKEGIYTISQAVSPYWKLVAFSQSPSRFSAYFNAMVKPAIGVKTSINGWQQAWYVDQVPEGSVLSVVYVPNILAYTGLFGGMGVAVTLVFIRGRQPRASGKDEPS